MTKTRKIPLLQVTPRLPNDYTKITQTPRMLIADIQGSSLMSAYPPCTTSTLLRSLDDTYVLELITSESTILR